MTDTKSIAEGGVGQMSCLQKVSVFITGGLENGFGKLGLQVAKRPVHVMVVCTVLSLLTGLGLLSFREESEPENLWLPYGIQIRENKEWVDSNFPSRVNLEKMLMTAGNILEAQKIQAIYDIYEESQTIQTSSGLNFSDVCVKAGSNCLVYGILEIWSFDTTTINALTDAQVLTDIKTTTVSPVYGNAIDLTTYLGDITYDGNGDITGAKAAAMTWLAEGNDEMKSRTKAWENKFISLGKRGHTDLSNVYVLALRSWSDESSAAISSDIVSLSIGYFLVIIFVTLVLGKFNFKEQKAWLTLAGLYCVGLSVLISIGLSSAFQQFYGPIQSVLPFLLLGLGVDDVFVIMSALSNLSPEEQKYDIPEKISTVLSRAGVSITVTSFTDVVAFMIGASTIIPALRSFCIYAGIGVLALYVLQAMFFTACLTIDLRREKENRGACCFMTKYKEDYQPNKCSQTQIIPLTFQKVVAPCLEKLPVKIFVLLASAAVLGVNTYGLVNLENYFDSTVFLSSDSYAYQFFRAEERHFPTKGPPGNIFCGQLSYFTHKTELETLSTLMDENKYIVNGTTDSWFDAFTDWLSTTADTDIIAMLDANRYPTTEDNFKNLTYRLTTEGLTRTAAYINFISTADPTIKASRFPMTHVVTNNADEESRVMDSAYQLVADAGFSSSECFPYAFQYLAWETNKIIKEELFRNVGLAMICVFLVSLLLIANIITSLFVFICVIATLINVAGTMYFWGLTIDTVTSVILILSVGLAVDYSAHIGHMFMTVRGDRKDRLKATIELMGPPVFYGGFSTFLAFILLANSTSYVFTTFFKVNFLTVFYGLFHGLVFLPVVLSLVGPDPYPNATQEYKGRPLFPSPNKVNDKPNGLDNTALEKGLGEGKKTSLPAIVNGKQENGRTGHINAGVEGFELPIRNASRDESNPSNSPPPSYRTAEPDHQTVPT